MKKKSLKEIVDEKVEQSKKYWANKPPLTETELKAVREFEDKKIAVFEKLLDTPEKRERINKMLKGI
jgi:hypothetical protein